MDPIIAACGNGLSFVLNSNFIKYQQNMSLASFCSSLLLVS